MIRDTLRSLAAIAAAGIAIYVAGALTGMAFALFQAGFCVTVACW